MISVIMSTFKCLSDKNSSKISEDECLYECHRYFDKINKHSKENGEWRKAPSRNCAHRPENKDEGDKAEDNDVPCDHIRKKTNH